MFLVDRRRWELVELVEVVVAFSRVLSGKYLVDADSSFDKG